MDVNKYEKIMLDGTAAADGLTRAFASASSVVRSKYRGTSDRDNVIRDVAIGVAGPALIGYVLWILERAHELGLQRLRFLSRDGQVLYQLAKRITERTGDNIDLEYVYSSRITWSLAASDPDHLSQFDWIFSSFMKPNARDLCERLGIDAEKYRGALRASGVSLDSRVRADSPAQLAALRRFVDRDDVAAAVRPRVVQAQALLIDYARQHALADPSTGLVDAGWTGRMVGSLVHVTEAVGLPRPHVFFWGHEPRPDGWTDPHRVFAYIYNTSRGEGLHWRVPDAPFIVETFCAGDHGIVAAYERSSDGIISARLRSEVNTPAQAWGLPLYRQMLLAMADELDLDAKGDLRPLIYRVMKGFWLEPSRVEATVWGGFPYDSDPTGTAIRPLAHSFATGDIVRGLASGRVDRADRAWLRGSLALSPTAVKLAATSLLPRKVLLGAPPAARDIPPR